jgi:cobalt/nickel transport protein
MNRTTINRKTLSLGVLASGVGIALLITLFSPFASSEPDGLETVAEEHGFLETAKDNRYEIIPDYAFPGIQNERVATILAGVAGVLIVTAISLVVARVLSRRAPSDGTGQREA